MLFAAAGMVLGNADVKLAAPANDGTQCPVAVLGSLSHMLFPGDDQYTRHVTLHSQNVPEHFPRGHGHADVSVRQNLTRG